MNAKVEEGDLLKNVDTNEFEIGSNRTIKIIKKAMYDESFRGVKEFFYGIAIYEGEKEFYRPTYPFVRSKEDVKNLEKFVCTYEKDLLDFYKCGHNYDFGRFIYGIGSGAKDYFRDKWFELGVLFY